jgi:hypothetical protein
MKLFPELIYMYITSFFQGLSYGMDIGTYEVLILQEVQDESDGCGAKFSVLIVSDKFEGKPLLQRHRYKVHLSFQILVLLTRLRK